MLMKKSSEHLRASGISAHFTLTEYKEVYYHFVSGKCIEVSIICQWKMHGNKNEKTLPCHRQGMKSCICDVGGLGILLIEIIQIEKKKARSHLYVESKKRRRKGSRT